MFRTKAEPLPPWIAARVHEPELGLNADLAQRVDTPTGTVVWVIPGNGFVCILRETALGPGYACSATKETIRHGIDLAWFDDGRTDGVTPGRVVVGIAPDDVQRATLRTGQTKVTVPVVESVFARRDGMTRAPKLILGRD